MGLVGYGISVLFAWRLYRNLKKKKRKGEITRERIIKILRNKGAVALVNAQSLIFMPAGRKGDTWRR